jgi:hypothetical protein
MMSWMDLMVVLRFDEDVQHDELLARPGDIDGSCDAIPPLHAHLPESSIQVADMQHADVVRSEALQQIGNAKKNVRGYLRAC